MACWVERTRLFVLSIVDWETFQRWCGICLRPDSTRCNCGIELNNAMSHRGIAARRGKIKRRRSQDLSGGPKRCRAVRQWAIVADQ